MASNWTECYRRNRRTTPRLGEIVLLHRHLGAGTLSHEVAHAAIAWAARVDLRVDRATNTPRPRRSWGKSLGVTDAEERFCWALGYMVNRLAGQLWDRGLVK